MPPSSFEITLPAAPTSKVDDDDTIERVQFINTHTTYGASDACRSSTISIMGCPTFRILI